MAAQAAPGGRTGEPDGVVALVRPHPGAVDAVVAGVLAVLLAAAAASQGPVLVLLSLVEVGALAVRRTRPAACAALVCAVAALHWAVQLLLGAGTGGVLALLPADLAVPVAVYSATAHGPRWLRTAVLGAGLAGAGVLALPVLAQGVLGGRALQDAVVIAAVLGAGAAAVVLAAWTAGQWRRTRTAHAGALVDRARSAETEREQALALAAAAERARIAREVHDVVAHSLSVVIAQADGGRYAAARDPAAAAAALETVAATGRAALADMRRLLGVLRPDGAPGLAPQPGADDVPDLVAGVRASGLPVALVTTGAARPLPPGAGLAVYRVVQESLTNVLKHGGPAARAQVRLHWGAAALEVVVADDGRGAAAAGAGAAEDAGRGLAGMAERVALYGGALRAGPEPGGGFAVRASLPWPRVGA